MPTPIWEPGTRYAPGALVQPRSTPPAFSTEITDPSLESGGGAWTLGSGITVGPGFAYAGTQSIIFSGTPGIVRALAPSVPCIAGKQITASCVYAQGAASGGNNVGRVILQWLDAADVLLREDSGNIISGSSPTWQQSTVTGVAPTSTAKVRIGVLSNRTNGAASHADNFTWNYTIPATTAGLIYKAVQAATGTSGNTEPTWPLTLGVTVVDNEVTWEAVLTSRVVWQAVPIMTSGATEPDWSTVVNGTVSDGTVRWRAISRRVEDANCPTSKIVAIAASKIYAGDDDIIRYCATNNPLDWSTLQDAGFVPFGLQQYGSNPVAAMGLYRGNLVPFNAEAFQMWQVDPDPANLAKIDELPIGSTHHLALTPVSNDLFFLSLQGVRTVGIAGGSTNLQAGDVGMPIDPLVRARLLQAIQGGEEPLATYYPNTGQYWLAFPYDGDIPEPVFALVTLWSGGSSSDGIAINPLESFNSELATSEADSVRITGYFTGGATYTYPPPEDPFNYDVSGKAFIVIDPPIELTTGNSGPGIDVWYSPLANNAPLPEDAQAIVEIQYQSGEGPVTTTYAAIYNSPGF